MGLTIQFIPFAEAGSLTPEAKLEFLLRTVREEKIILLEGKLKSSEKSELIRKTMESISEGFTGIEIEEFELEHKGLAFTEKLKKGLANMLLGDRQGLTIIGPASIIKEIKKDPDKIMLMTRDDKGTSKRKVNKKRK